MARKEAEGQSGREEREAEERRMDDAFAFFAVVGDATVDEEACSVARIVAFFWLCYFEVQQECISTLLLGAPGEMERRRSGRKEREKRKGQNKSRRFSPSPPEFSFFESNKVKEPSLSFSLFSS